MFNLKASNEKVKAFALNLKALSVEVKA